MQKWIYGLITCITAAIGFVIAFYLISPLIIRFSFAANTAALIAAPVLFGLLGLIFAPKLYKFISLFIDKCINKLSAVPLKYIICSVLGLIFGLIIASLIATVISRIAVIGSYIAIVLMLFFGYLGAVTGYKKADDILAIREHFKNDRGEKGEKQEKTDIAAKPEKEKKSIFAGSKIAPKILDTSVIIDGRIADIYKTGFIEGDLIIPGFVLEELRHIADSSDSLKRNRGRRGLDILNKLRNDFGEQVRISEKNYADIEEVDSKLLKMAQDLHGIVLTNDYNLNKVAQFQGVKVLNINELSNAVKPVVLPGEEMVVTIVKEGKEHNQGVAYLDDGTMIVVENGIGSLNKTIYVIVTSVLQTAAGKMIFARPKFTENGSVWEYSEESEASC